MTIELTFGKIFFIYIGLVYIFMTFFYIYIWLKEVKIPNYNIDKHIFGFLLAPLTFICFLMSIPFVLIQMFLESFN